MSSQLTGRLAVLTAACGALAAQQVVLNSGSKFVLSGSNISFSSMAMTNCLAAPVTCGALAINGDPYSTGGNFAGYADPTERMDPQTGTLWLAYSWPTVLGDGTKVVNIDVAYSTDRGSSWSNAGLANNGVLYSTQVEFNGYAGVTNHTSHEVMEIYPQVVGATTYWYGIHSTYDVPNGGSGTGQTYTQRQVMAACAGTASQGPMCLSSAPPQYLGGSEDNQQAYYPTSVNLTTLSGLTGCTDFREPSFIIQSVAGTPTLYLFLNCGDMSNYAQFSTPAPQSHIGAWQWTYSGATSYLPASSGFAVTLDAQSVCAFLASCAYTNYLTQTEVSLAAGNIPGLPAGTPIELFDLVHMVAGAKVSSGIVVTALSRISPPSFVRTPSGAVRVYAVIPSTDSLVCGPGTSTYDPASTSTGVLVAHKLTNCTGGSPGCDAQGGLFTYLSASGVRP